MKPHEFAGQTVFIPGGSMGLGLAAARRLAALGAHVVVFARRRGPLEAAGREIAAARRDVRQTVAHYELDVGDPEAVREVVTAAIAAHGTPAALLNCAGQARPGYFEDITQERLTETLRVNLHSCWNTMQVLVPHMKARGGGYIVNTASVAGLIGVIGFSDYCAAKFAVVGLSEALRCELAPHGITVSVLCPPDMDTPGYAIENQSKPAETRAVSAGARIMTADEAAVELLAGMARRAAVIVPGRDARLVVRIKRWVPRIVEWMMARQIRAVQRRG
ncbi:SDR family NAD(P)-dependent oxidoreductase [Candidatus Binatia bacterium]|nr:SDR family NAD(P)-dependent oxidoreductase [Candidatus Binatia bacterium]